MKSPNKTKYKRAGSIRRINQFNPAWNITLNSIAVPNNKHIFWPVYGSSTSTVKHIQEKHISTNTMMEYSIGSIANIFSESTLVRPAKTQIRLRGCAVWSESSLIQSIKSAIQSKTELTNLENRLKRNCDRNTALDGSTMNLHLCDQRRLRSTYASAQSDQSLRWSNWSSLQSNQKQN